MLCTVVPTNTCLNVRLSKTSGILLSHHPQTGVTEDPLVWSPKPEDLADIELCRLAKTLSHALGVYFFPKPSGWGLLDVYVKSAFLLLLSFTCLLCKK